MEFKGLSTEQVEESRQKYGNNTIAESQPTTFWDEFKETFKDPMIRILLAIVVLMTGMFCFGYAEIYEPVGTATAVLIVALVTAKTGVASDKAYRRTKAGVKKETVRVRRNDSVEEISIDDVVVGDCVILQSGDKVPADGVLVAGDLRVDNSALNGESEECKKYAANSDYVFPEEITGDTFVDKSSLFRGSVVTGGDGVCVVKKVGMSTMMGRMADEMSAEEPDSPLKVKLNKLAHQISVFGYVGACVIAVLLMASTIVDAGGFNQYLQSGVPTILQDVISAVSLAIVIIVCAVPEGLPLMISIVLMQNTSKMLAHNVLVRKAVGIETAGSLNLLFSDKTGTITKGQLEVVEFFTADGESTVLEKASKDFLYAIAKNTQAVFGNDGRVLGGNFTDKALLEFLGQERFEGISKDGSVVEAKQDFNSTNKFSQATVNGRVYYKGAPERLLAKAKQFIDSDGAVQTIDHDTLNDAITAFANRSMRVLAFGYSDSPMTEDSINDGVVITGLVGIRDDVRPDAKEAIESITNAGIQLVMVTGDRLETARAIATDAGLFKEDSLAITSAELNAMDDESVKGILPRLCVVARALPTDKSRLVRIAQSMNLVVGMTGDGVNDSPALKLADVGFAMGSGTEVAKEASKIVILDDSLKSISDAVLYGRTIYHNILKFCNFQLMINVCAVVVSALSPFVGIHEPLKVTHLLFVNLVMDSLGALMLGNEPALKKYMSEKPRRKDESIVSKSMAISIVWQAIFAITISFLYLLHPSVQGLFQSTEEHLTGYFVLFISMSLFNGFNVRDKGFGVFKGLTDNKDFVKVLVLIAVIQAVIVYASVIPGFGFIGKMFSCTPFQLVLYVGILAISAFIIPFDFIRKAVVRGD